MNGGRSHGRDLKRIKQSGSFGLGEKGKSIIMRWFKSNIVGMVIILVLLLVIFGLIFSSNTVMDFNWFTVFLTIACSLTSGLLAVFISTRFYISHEIRTKKLEILRSFMGNRFDLQSNEFSRTINAISIVFANSPEVREKLSNFHQKTVQGKPRNNELFELFKAMCNDVGVPADSESDRSFFFTPFNVSP